MDTYVGVTVQNLRQRQAQVTNPVAITAVALELCVYWHVFCASAAFFYTAERYLQSQSHLKCQDDFRSAFPKYQVQGKSTAFRWVAIFRETWNVSDPKLPDLPIVLTKARARVWEKKFQQLL